MFFKYRTLIFAINYFVHIFIKMTSKPVTYVNSFVYERKFTVDPYTYKIINTQTVLNAHLFCGVTEFHCNKISQSVPVLVKVNSILCQKKY